MDRSVRSYNTFVRFLVNFVTRFPSRINKQAPGSCSYLYTPKGKRLKVDMNILHLRNCEQLNLQGHGMMERSEEGVINLSTTKDVISDHVMNGDVTQNGEKEAGQVYKFYELICIVYVHNGVYYLKCNAMGRIV